VHAGRLRRDEQLPGDLAITAAGGHQAEHLVLARGEPEPGFPGGRPTGDRKPRSLGEVADLGGQRRGANVIGELRRPRQISGRLLALTRGMVT
jgi:hypothetical protein